MLFKFTGWIIATGRRLMRLYGEHSFVNKVWNCENGFNLSDSRLTFKPRLSLIKWKDVKIIYTTIWNMLNAISWLQVTRLTNKFQLLQFTIDIVIIIWYFSEYLNSNCDRVMERKLFNQTQMCVYEKLYIYIWIETLELFIFVFWSHIYILLKSFV